MMIDDDSDVHSRKRKNGMMNGKIRKKRKNDNNTLNPEGRLVECPLFNFFRAQQGVVKVFETKESK